MMITRHARPEQSQITPLLSDDSNIEKPKRAFTDVLPTLEDLHAFFRERLLTVNQGDSDTNEVPLLWRPGAPKTDQQPLRKIGFALDHRARLTAHADLDALFLHRPFFLPDDVLPDVPVFASHAGFDRCLSIGYNATLAEVLGLLHLTPLYAEGSATPIGMVGDLKTPLTWYAFRALIAQQYQGTEMIGGTVRDPVTRRVAIVGAMSPELIAQAAEMGARVFVTGQYRPSARLALETNRMMVVAVGHRRAELWGLRRLATETAAAFLDVQTTVIE